MATEKPRITVTLTDEQYLIIAKLAELRGVSMSRVVVELLEQVLPAMQRMNCFM